MTTFASLDFETANPSRVSICAAGIVALDKCTIMKSQMMLALVRSDAYVFRYE